MQAHLGLVQSTLVFSVEVAFRQLLQLFRDGAGGLGSLPSMESLEGVNGLRGRFSAHVGGLQSQSLAQIALMTIPFERISSALSEESHRGWPHITQFVSSIR